MTLKQLLNASQKNGPDPAPSRTPSMMSNRQHALIRRHMTTLLRTFRSQGENGGVAGLRRAVRRKRG